MLTIYSLSCLGKSVVLLAKLLKLHLAYEFLNASLRHYPSQNHRNTSPAGVQLLVDEFVLSLTSFVFTIRLE